MKNHAVMKVSFTAGGQSEIVAVTVEERYLEGLELDSHAAEYNVHVREHRYEVLALLQLL